VRDRYCLDYFVPAIEVGVARPAELLTARLREMVALTVDRALKADDLRGFVRLRVEIAPAPLLDEEDKP